MRKGAFKMPKLLKELFKVDLQLFNDGGAAGAEGAGATATENAPKAEVKSSGSSRRSKSGELSDVVYGKQEGTTSDDATSLEAGDTNPTGAGNEDGETSIEDRRKAFNDLINGEYKDVYQENFQQVFDRRFKQVKGMESELAAHKPIIEKLMARYGVDDVAQLEQALTEDTEYWERVAEENGMTVEQYHAMQKLEQENKEYKALRQRAENQQKFQAQLNAWNEEAKEVKQMYPSFDLKAEVQNKAFLDMLGKGVSMEHAYKVLHFDELTNDAARAAAKTADERAQARLKQKASRPSENGTSSQSAAIVKNDVTTLTPADRAEIARRVARGEKIIF